MLPEVDAAAIAAAERETPPVTWPGLYLLIALMVAMWSANFIIGKVAVREFSAWTLSGIRVVAAALILAVAFTASRGWAAWRGMFGEWRLMVWMSLFSVVLNQGLFIAGLKYTSVAHSSLIISLGPVFVLLIARLHGLEELTPLKITGLVVSMVGVGILGTERQAITAAGQGPTLFGDLLAAAGSACFAYFVVAGKELTGRYDSLTFNTYTYVIGAVMMLPMTVWTAMAGGASGASAKAWLALVYMAAAASVAAYLIFYYALKFIAATRLSALSYLQPVIATALGFLLLKEPVTMRLVLGAFIIFSGVYLTEKG